MAYYAAAAAANLDTAVAFATCFWCNIMPTEHKVHFVCLMGVVHNT